MTANIAPLAASPSTTEPALGARRLHEARTFAAAQEELGAAELARALDEGTWVQLWWGVVVPEHRMRDPLTRAAAALLRAGPAAVLAGPTAAAMHGCTAAHAEVAPDADPGPPETLHVVIPYDRQMRSRPGLSVRQAWVRETDVVELDGLRTQALDVALAELLCIGPQRVALACLEQALGQFPPETGERLRRLVGQRIARRRDRRGTRQAAGLLELAWVGGPPETCRPRPCPSQTRQPQPGQPQPRPTEPRPTEPCQTQTESCPGSAAEREWGAAS